MVNPRFVLNRPDVKYFCNLDYDPFKLMEANDKIYGASSHPLSITL